MKLTLIICFLTLCLCHTLPGHAQNKPIEIKGTVTDDDGLPAIAITIRHKDANGELYGNTDLDGHFTIMADPATSLHFSGLTYRSKVVKIKGKQQLNVTLSFESQQLDEVVVTAKRIVDKLVPEPTEIEVVGNQYVIRPKVRIPRKLFSPYSRVIVQPMLVNVTRGTQRLFRPAVVTGKKYAITLERMMEFDLNRDPFHPYYQKSKRVGGDEIIAYTDSLFLESPDDECRCDIFTYMVKYSKAAYQDTVVIAKGSINPMRFFNFDIGAKRITSDKYIPRPQKQMRGDKGQVNLTFMVNSAKIDNSSPQNINELNLMREKLNSIEKDPNAEFTAFSIKGISSPEGLYKGNLSLAQKRTQTAKETILRFLNAGTIATMRDSIHTDASVESWQRVVELMRKDSLTTHEMERIIDQNPDNPDAQFRKIMYLPEYNAVIKEKYLKQLRRVEYSFNYSVMRWLTDEEIANLYQKNYKQLSPYEFWRMYINSPAEAEKEKICRQALEMHPTFTQAANELAVLLIGRNEPDAHLLSPFINDKAPEELICNHIIALLHEREYMLADSISSLLSDGQLTTEIKTVVEAFNGKYQNAYDYFAAQGGTNEVVLLLALKRNEEAFEKAELLPENALTYYLRATAANRLEKLTEAFSYLKKAIAEDPHYKEIAQIDGDVVDILQQMEEESKEKDSTNKEEEKDEQTN